ncbi:MAG: hypothetical protein WC812_02260 [Candidatus Pacearchaeota archaeon]|jgi:hypothetical protein
MKNEEDNLVYELAAIYKKIDCDLSNEGAIRNAIKYIFLNTKNPNKLYESIGGDASLDFQSLESYFMNETFDDLLDSCNVLSSKGLSNENVLKNIHKALGEKNHEKAKEKLYYILAEKIRKLHFPSSGLESIIIANGDDY